MSSSDERAPVARRARDWLRRHGSISSEAMTVKQIAAGMVRLRSVDRERIAAYCSRTLREPELQADESLRALLAKVIVAALPESLLEIEALLQAEPTGSLAEVQFSLFSFLDEVPDSWHASGESERVLELVSRYLLNVRKDVAQAAWMAGDLLGDHWPIKASLAVLEQAALNGRFVAGREGALHGLSHALERAPKRSQWSIVETLKAVVAKDRSARVRKYAQLILEDLRGI